MLFLATTSLKMCLKKWASCNFMLPRYPLMDSSLARFFIKFHYPVAISMNTKSSKKAPRMGDVSMLMLEKLRLSLQTSRVDQKGKKNAENESKSLFNLTRRGTVQTDGAWRNCLTIVTWTKALEISRPGRCHGGIDSGIRGLGYSTIACFEWRGARAWALAHASGRYSSLVWQERPRYELGNGCDEPYHKL